MSRYIDKEYALASVCSGLIRTIDGEDWIRVSDVRESIMNTPTIDAVPVSTLEQIKWERDSFAEQIREIGGEPFAKWDAMDVVKVVRCKDCVYGRPYNKVWYQPKKDSFYCLKNEAEKDENWYCADGKKVME